MNQGVYNPMRCEWSGLVVTVFLLCVLRLGAAKPAVLEKRDVSFQNEIQRAIDRGLGWLHENQNTNGCWSTPDQPAVTALALTAWCGNPAASSGGQDLEWIKKG